LWLWFPRLPVPVQMLYERLKARGVLVIPGHHFGPGLAEPWPHLDQCLRLSYAQPEAALRRGLATLAEELKALGYPH
jgi:valine--pyruvate aminotransferase